MIDPPDTLTYCQHCGTVQFRAWPKAQGERDTLLLYCPVCKANTTVRRLPALPPLVVVTPATPASEEAMP